MPDSNEKPKPLDPAKRSELMDKATRPTHTVSEDLERALANYQRATQENWPVPAVNPQERKVTWH